MVVYLALVLMTYHVCIFASRGRLIGFVADARTYADRKDDFVLMARRVFKKSLICFLIILGCIVLEIGYMFLGLFDGDACYIDALYFAMCLVWVFRIVYRKEFMGYVKSWGFHTVAVLYYTYTVCRLTMTI